MIPFKTLRTLDHFAVIQPPTNAKYIFFQGGLLLFLPVCINVNWKGRKLLLSKARHKMCPNLILIKDQFRGIDFFFLLQIFNFLLAFSTFSIAFLFCLLQTSFWNSSRKAF